MKTIYLDFETYYSKEYSLRKMTPVEYILHPEYATIGCAVIEDDDDPFWLEGDGISHYLRKLDVSKCRVVSHNALFDMSILAYRYQLYPRLSVDTMSMARALLSHILPGGSVSLEKVGQTLGVGEKGTALQSVLGMSLDEIKQAGRYKALVEYALNDVQMCRGIYKKLVKDFPPEQFIINDMLIRMVTQPQFVINLDKLHAHLSSLVAQKQNLLDRIGVDKEDLMSNDKFALALQALGVEPVKKISVRTGEETWAFAKTDAFMSDLEFHENQDVQALVAARLGHKSTLEETRTQRFIDIANVTWDGTHSWMPIPLQFSGAHTHRFSGGWRINPQNLPSRGVTLLRESLEAPPGYVVVTCDASQIEARLTAFLCEQTNLLKQFEKGEDVYSVFASDIYETKVTKQDKEKRFLGKTSVLGLGFGMGHKKFFQTVRIQAAAQGLDLQFDENEAKRVVNLYRNKHAKIYETWSSLNDAINDMMTGHTDGRTLGPCVFEKGAIRLPSGLRLFYHDIKWDSEFKTWSFTYGGKRKHIYGGKILENIVQALDIICVMSAALRIKKRTAQFGYNLAHQVHDEIVYVVREEHADEIKQILLEEMARRPEWGVNLPLAAEAGIGQNYAQAK